MKGVSAAVVATKAAGTKGLTHLPKRRDRRRRFDPDGPAGGTGPIALAPTGWPARASAFRR